MGFPYRWVILEKLIEDFSHSFWPLPKIIIMNGPPIPPPPTPPTTPIHSDSYLGFDIAADIHSRWGFHIDGSFWKNLARWLKISCILFDQSLRSVIKLWKLLPHTTSSSMIDIRPIYKAKRFFVKQFNFLQVWLQEVPQQNSSRLYRRPQSTSTRQFFLI